MTLNWVTIIWSMITAACLTLAVIHGLVYCQNRQARSNLVFAVLALAVAGMAAIELASLGTAVPRTYSALLRWGHVAVLVMVGALLIFVRLYLRAGRLWLAWATLGVRVFSVAANFLTGENLNYRTVTAMRPLSLFRETLFVPEGVPNPWMVTGSLSALMMVAFLLDATFTAWRRGDRRRAVTVGGSVTLALLLASINAVLVVKGIYSLPIIVSPFLLGFILSMNYELSRDLAEAAQVGRRLQASEAALRESQQRMKLAAEAARVALWSWDIPRDLLWVSPEGQGLYGLASGEVINLSRFLGTLHPEDQARIQAAVEQSLRGDGRFQADYRVRLPDGEERWIAATGQVEFDARRQPLRMLGVSLDFTDRRRAELEAQEQRTNLAHAGRVSLLGQLASALAHELSQPLGAILRNAEAAELMLRTPSPDLAELRAIVADIRADDQRAGRVIDRLRSLFKRRSVDLRPIQLDEVIVEVMSLLHVDAAVRQVKLACSGADGLPPVRGDRIHLQQVLLNLLMNAMDALAARPPGERCVEIVVHRTEGNLIEVRVCDNGPGLPANSAERLFEPFFTTKAHGMGMGLPVCKAIIAAHRGTIRAENRPEGGACFCFTVPVDASVVGGEPGSPP